MSRPIDSDTGQPWSAGTSRAVFQEIRAQAIADLRARDERRNVNVATYKLGDSKRYVPDEEVVELKHTAQETEDLVHYRWQQFLSKPQSETTFQKERTRCDAQAIAPSLERAGKAVERSLTESDERAPKRRRKGTSKT